MIAQVGFDTTAGNSPQGEDVRQAVVWLAAKNRLVADSHMALADMGERLMGRFLNDRRSRASLRAFARQNRRSAWQHLVMAVRAEAVLKNHCTVFDLRDLISPVEMAVYP